MYSSYPPPPIPFPTALLPSIYIIAVAVISYLSYFLSVGG